MTSFRANYACRFCRAPKELMQKLLVEDLTLLRNKENFVQDLELDDVSRTGIKRSTVLNNLRNFHACENYTVDVMHDFLEGIIPFEIKLIINSLIGQGCFSLQDLNDRLSSFNYGFEDKKNKPSLILPSQLTNPSGASGQKAAQMKCLALYLPLIVGDLVDENSDAWELFLLLLDIFKIVLAPYISEGGICVLKALIRDHHHLFLELFQDCPLKPKHHILVHYPRLIGLLGPLVQYSSLRKEGKHKPFKQWARMCNNYKNVTKTVAERHQQQQSFLFLLRKPLIHEIEIRDQMPCVLSSIDDSGRLSSELQCSLNESVLVASSVRIQMYDFKPQCMLLLDWHDENGPQFAYLKHIIAHGDKLYFVSALWKSVFYDRHKHAYAVKESGEIQISQPQDLCLLRPLHITKSYETNDPFWYIIVPYQIV